MKRAIGVLFGSWVVLFLLSFATAKSDLSLPTRILYTGVLALVATLLFFGKGVTRKQTSGATSSGSDMDIHLPTSPKVLYRIRSGKVYEGMAAAPIYEINGNKIYPNLSSKPAFRIEKNKVYRGMDPAPFLEIKGEKVYHNLSSKVAYEIKVLR